MEQIYQEHAQNVYKYLLSLAHDEDIAKELTQETFYRAVYSINTYFRIETSLENEASVDAEEVYFNIDMALLNDKELWVRREYIYGEKNEAGIRPVLGYILIPYEVQPSFIQDDHSNTYSFGISSNCFENDNFSVVLRLKDRDITFTQNDLDQLRGE